jgi:uncharacterized protein
MNDQAFAQPSARFPRCFQVVVKPVGSRCNLDCTYCYYLHKEHLLADRTPGHMAEDLFEEFVRQYIAGQELDEVVFNWHGGEPALLGLEFFRKAVELEHRHAAGKRIKIKNDFQTNGVLLDDAWCDFLKEHGFYVGLSIDGPRHLHDRYRVAKGGRPTFDAVCRAVRLLQKHQVPFTTLTVVHHDNAREPEAVWRFLTEELGCTRLQWLPCVEPKVFASVAPRGWPAEHMPMVGTPAGRPGSADSVVTDWSVDPDDWGEFLCRTFDLWLKTGLGRVLVNWFDSLVGVWMNEPPSICTLAAVCGRSLVTLEKDGTLYSCDRFVYPEYRLGNLNEPGFQLAEAVYSPQQRQFGTAKHTTLTEACQRCEYLFACYGECPKNRFVRSPDGHPGHNYLCPGLKRFFGHADPHLRQIAGRVQRNRATRLGTTTVQVAAGS